MRFTKLKSSYWSLLIIAILMSAAFATRAAVESVAASIDKNPAMADESIVLTVVATGSARGDEFDPSILDDDFVVGRTSVSTQTRVVNFDTTRSTTWTTILIPRKEGSFVLPAFNVGGKTTQPIPLRVIPASSAGPGQAREAFVTAQVDDSVPYVQQVVKYTVKIHLGAELQRGSLPEPTVTNAEIRSLGKDNEYSDIIDGQRYRIIERSYAIIPQSSGLTTIKGPMFEGEIVSRNRTSFSYFNRTRPINRVAPDIELNVQPIPGSFTQQWLPSEFVQLNEEWQPALDQIRVGEPITRTITLSALGVAQEQLPEITGDYPPGFKVYPDQPATTSVARDGNIIAQRVENIALIPNREGQFVLPPVRVPWFNLQNNQIEYAEIPPQSINVLPGQINGQIQPPPNTPQNQSTEINTLDTPYTEQPQTHAAPQSTSYWSLSSWILLVLWMVTLMFWWLTSIKKPVDNIDAINENTNEKEAWGQLLNHIKNQNVSQTYQGLQFWLAELLDNRNADLSTLQSILNSPELDEQISLMMASQYARDDIQWKSDKLKQVISRIRNDYLNSTHNKSALQPLYN